jgi:hypothetical protein
MQPRTSTTLTSNSNHHDSDEDLELIELERRLNEEVDEDFFQEPKRFQTINRVIDVLGLQMLDDATVQSNVHNSNDLARTNPAYRNLKDQQQIVEGAIEHMAVIHCADLNGSVIQVGRVSRQFGDAVHKVRNLRKQVRDIQDSLGAGSQNSGNTNNETAVAAAGSTENNKSTNAARPQNAAAMSLRELWLKKLECEACLALLDKLDVIRAAPARFDGYVTQPPCRIGAAVLVLSTALQTMFSDDVAQVQALHKIMEQLLLRKQRAEEIVWETTGDIVFLRNGNVYCQQQQQQQAVVTIKKRRKKFDALSAPSVSSDPRRSATVATTVTTGGGSGMVNPFAGHWSSFTAASRNQDNDDTDDGDVDDNDDDQSVQSTGSAASAFSLHDDAGRTNPASLMRTANSSITTTTPKRTMMIPLPMVEAELDLEADERRCLEEVALSGLALAPAKKSTSGGGTRGSTSRILPRYADPVLALRIMVECLAKLKRLDDVERVMAEGLEKEIAGIVQQEQARTFARLEREKKKRVLANSGGVGGGIRLLASSNKSDDMQDFKRHLNSLLLAFGNIMIRLSHLAEILRFRIVRLLPQICWMSPSKRGRVLVVWRRQVKISLNVASSLLLSHTKSSDKDLLQTIVSPSSVMRSVLSAANDLMQREIREFLKACLHETEGTRNEALDNSMRHGSTTLYESGLFSLGIVTTNGKSGPPVSTATRSNVKEMPVAKFVSTILFARTKNEPQVRHALTFRRSVARWTSELEAARKELVILTGEDTSVPSYNKSSSQSTEESAILYLDKVIQNDLLPVLQEEAVNGTVQGLERRDAFDPVLDRSLYARPSDTNEPQDVDMCISCQAIYTYTGPLFMALHRLPLGGEMYLPLVAVLEHVVLTFMSRVKQQVGKICNGKTALNLLMQDSSEASSLSSVFERRRPFAQLLQAYADTDLLVDVAASASAITTTATGPEERVTQPSGLRPLDPPSSDTVTQRPSEEDNAVEEEFGEGRDGEEAALEFELSFLKPFLDFSVENKRIVVCTDEELMRAACLAHSLLKLAGLLESRLKIRTRTGKNRLLTSTRALREAIKTIKSNGIKMAKFCRLDMLMQTLIRISKVCRSSTLVAQDAVRIPSSVNDLGEYLTSASDNLREAAGNAVTGYTFSSLEQYIPFFLMQSVRVVARGMGIITKSPLTMNGIESLDRSGSVLYRDLKGATSFENSFWEVELAAASFEQSAGFMAMLEFDMEELVAYYTANRDDFTEADFQLMFAMNGPRRRGDVGRYHMTKRQLQ